MYDDYDVGTSTGATSIVMFQLPLFATNVEPGMDEPTYVERICSSLQIPNWKVNPHFVKTTVQKRASDFYQQSVANKSNNVNGGGTGGANDDAEGGEPDDTVTDDAEEGSAVGTEDTEDDDDEEIEEGGPTDDNKQNAKKTIKSNNRGGSKNKQMIKRKLNSGKVQQRAPTRGRKPSNRGRGRGGGLRGQAKQA